MKTIAAFALLTAVSATASKRAPSDKVDDTTILNYALTLEHLENAFYTEALGKYDEKAFTDAGLPSTARGLFEQVAAHEKAHVDFLSTALGDNATQPCEYKFPYNDPKEFAALSLILEGVGVSAYAGAAQYITNPAYLTVAAVVLSTEARHAAFVASANDVEPWSGPLDVPLTLDQVYSLAAPFIVSCPTSNPVLPVKAFPTLTFSPKTAQPGDEIELAFQDCEDGQIVYFITGLTPLNATVSGGKVTIPKALNGTVYMTVAQPNATSVSDDTTVAGPAIFEFQKTVGALADNSSKSTKKSDASPSTAQSNTKNGATGAPSATSVMAMLALAPITGLVMALWA